MSFPLRGTFLGITAGFNRQLGSTVFGIEADVSVSDIDGTIVVGGPTDTVRRDIQAFGTLRGRVGYSLGRVLPYVTGGLYWQKSKVHVNLPGAGLASEVAVSDNSLGWALGGGIEVAIVAGWSVKAEYIYAKTKAEYTIPLPFGTIVAPTKGHVNLLRAGLIYAF